MKKLEKKLNEDIICNCPACKKHTYFKYIGQQETANHIGVNLYNCLSCNTTRTEISILKYNNLGVIYITPDIYELLKKKFE